MGFGTELEVLQAVRAWHRDKTAWTTPMERSDTWSLSDYRLYAAAEDWIAGIRHKSIQAQALRRERLQ